MKMVQIKQWFLIDELRYINKVSYYEIQSSLYSYDAV